MVRWILVENLPKGNWEDLTEGKRKYPVGGCSRSSSQWSCGRNSASSIGIVGPFRCDVMDKCGGVALAVILAADRQSQLFTLFVICLLWWEGSEVFRQRMVGPSSQGVDCIDPPGLA